MILMDLTFAVEDEGARVLEARDVDRAIDHIETGRPDAAVLDVNLGRGVTCERVAQRLRAAGVPFVLHLGDLDRQGEFIAAIGAEVVPKPTPSHLVVQRVIAMIGKAPADP